VVLIVSHLLSNIAPVSMPLSNAQMEFSCALVHILLVKGIFKQ